MMAEQWIWISFADKPKGFLGACIVKGAHVDEGIAEAWRLNINPGGQALASPFPEDFVPSSAWTNKLLDKDEATACCLVINALLK